MSWGMIRSVPKTSPPPIPSNSALFEGTAILSGVRNHSGCSQVHSFNPTMHCKNECTTVCHRYLLLSATIYCEPKIVCLLFNYLWLFIKIVYLSSMPHCPFVLRTKLQPVCFVFVFPRVVIWGGVVASLCQYSTIILCDFC